MISKEKKMYINVMDSGSSVSTDAIIMIHWKKARKQNNIIYLNFYFLLYSIALHYLYFLYLLFLYKTRCCLLFGKELVLDNPNVSVIGECSLPFVLRIEYLNKYINYYKEVTGYT